MFYVKPFQEQEIKCMSLESAINCAKDKAISSGYADITQNDKYLYTFYTYKDSTKVYEIKH